MDTLSEFMKWEIKAKDFGFYWESTAQIADWVLSEAQEIKDTLQNQESRERLQEEIGDLLHATMSLALYEGFDIAETLALATHKFAKRFCALEDLAKKQGLTTLKGESTEFMLDLWKEAKTLADS